MLPGSANANVSHRLVQTIEIGARALAAWVVVSWSNAPRSLASLGNCAILCLHSNHLSPSITGP